jgi:predicted RNA-binding Zn ribbon-like protein
VTFYFIADSPAIDFVNTEIAVDGERADLLTSPAELFAWLAQASVAKSGQLASLRREMSRKELASFLAEAKAFRGELRKAVEALASGARVPAGAIRAINGYLNARAPEVEVRAAGSRFELVEKTRVDSADALLAPIARSAAELLCFRDPSLVRKCEGQRCILYFLDTSKAHRRRWCSMQACGNRAKAAAHYQRTRGAK